VLLREMGSVTGGGMWSGVALRTICRVLRLAMVGDKGVELVDDSLERLREASDMV
jgi:hypothetical protein